MKKMRIAIIVIGILLPYLARIPRGYGWLAQYFSNDSFLVNFGGALFLGAFNAIAWGSILYVSFRYKHPVSMLFPAIFGFGFLAFCHFNLDLASSSTAAVALAFIPIYAAAFFVSVGALQLGYFCDKLLKRHDAAKNQS
ncbi:MAG: hypothetical protein WDM76_08540 [Limisphaerales bacterium]